MNQDEARRALMNLWLDKAEEAVASAQIEIRENHLAFAVNRMYYACFYAATAALLKEGKQFAKHSAVKAEFGRTYIKSGKADAKWFKFYQKLFDDRQEGDYLPSVSFDKTDVTNRLEQTEEFVRIIRSLLTSP